MHYSFRKAASVLGLGANNLIFVKSDGLGRICLPDLEEKICVCRKDKLMVLAIVGVAGSTERGSIDPLAEMGRIASRHGIHFHVDAAWGGALIFSGKHRHLLKGIEMADSITFCGHKQLYLPQGISICLFKDPGQLNYSSIQANYQATAGSLDLGRFTIEGSRPALSICLHASLHILGPDGYGLLVDNGIEKAVSFSRMIGAAEGLELISRQMNIVNYRFIQPLLRAKWRAGELDQDMNEQISRMNKDIQECQFLAGRTFVSRTVINHERYGRILVFRAVLSNPLTTEEDLFRVLEDQASIADKLYSTQTIPQQYDEHK
jgi:glutamate/tyrosine decarboxylase-like PLP-dependent enzyme